MKGNSKKCSAFRLEPRERSRARLRDAGSRQSGFGHGLGLGSGPTCLHTICIRSLHLKATDWCVISSKVSHLRRQRRRQRFQDRMNGVRRLLGATSASSSPTQEPQLAQVAPLSFAKSGTTWPASSPSLVQQALPVDAMKPTAALFLKKDRRPLPPTSVADEDNAGSTSFQSTRSSGGPSGIYSPRSQPSPTRTQTIPNSPSSVASSSPSSRLPSRKSVRKSETEWKRTSAPLNTRDELLMSLMASEAVVDSRDFEILTAEEVDELKKVRIRTLSSLIDVDFVKGTTSSYFKARSYGEKAQFRD